MPRRINGAIEATNGTIPSGLSTEFFVTIVGLISVVARELGRGEQ